MMDVLETLKAMRRLLTPEGSWCQKTGARDINGDPADELPAVSWCLVGACSWVLGISTGVEWHSRSATYTAALAALDIGGVVEFNDAPGRTHADILALLDERIAALSRPVGGLSPIAHRELEEVL